MFVPPTWEISLENHPKDDGWVFPLVCGSCFNRAALPCHCMSLCLDMWPDNVQRLGRVEMNTGCWSGWWFQVLFESRNLGTLNEYYVTWLMFTAMFVDTPSMFRMPHPQCNAQLSWWGIFSYLLTLLLWRPWKSVFLDIGCINQEDASAKTQGILSMGGILKQSRTMWPGADVMVMDGESKHIKTCQNTKDVQT